MSLRHVFRFPLLFFTGFSLFLLDFHFFLKLDFLLDFTGFSQVVTGVSSFGNFGGGTKIGEMCSQEMWSPGAGFLSQKLGVFMSKFFFLSKSLVCLNTRDPQKCSLGNAECKP